MRAPIRIGIADSGINPRHRQIGSVAGGVGVLVREGEVVTDDDWIDQLGHGTAVAATIVGHAPEAELYSIRIFRRRLEAHVEALLHAIDWALSQELDVLNLSLGCADLGRERDFETASRAANDRGLILVAPREASGQRSLPGSLEGVIAVAADPALDGHEIRYQDGVFVASPWARPLGELPKERNFKGVSLAVAHVSGLVALALEGGVVRSEVPSALASQARR